MRSLNRYYFFFTLPYLLLCTAFNVTFPSASSITECNTVNMAYSTNGGSGSTRLLIVGPWGPARAEPLNAQAGSNVYSFRVNYQAGRRFTLTLEDDEDSRTSELFTVNNRTSGVSTCAYDNSDAAFLFSIEPSTGPVQCQQFRYTWNYTGAAFAYFIIPGQKAIRRSSSTGDDSFTWPNLPIAAGTQTLITAFTSDYQDTGGSGDLYTVGQSNDTSCLPKDNPGSSPSKGLAGGAIAGIVIAALVVLFLIGLVLWLLRRARQRKPSQVVDLTGTSEGGNLPSIQSTEVDPYLLQTPPAYTPSDQDTFRTSQLSSPQMQALGLGLGSDSRPVSMLAAGVGNDPTRRSSVNTSGNDSAAQYQSVMSVVGSTKEGARNYPVSPTSPSTTDHLLGDP